MSQESLFHARLYVRRAYEYLVLAYEAHALEELGTLKNAVFRGLITVENIALEQLDLTELTDDDANVPF